MNRTLLDLGGPLAGGRLVVEASAGTGKTYSLAALVARHVAERGLPASSLLVVTFTRAAAAELRDRVRRVLVAAAAAVESGDVPVDQPWMTALLHDDPVVRATRRRHLLDAVGSFDDATVTTIHSFCQQTLRQLGLRSGTPVDVAVRDSTAELIEEVCRDLLTVELLTLPTALDWPDRDGMTPTKVSNSLLNSVRARLTHPTALSLPDPLSARPVKGDRPERLQRWVELVDQAVAEVARRRTARHELGYDDLVLRLRDALQHHTDGPTVASMLRERYRLVLVDEFQDTDPAQWDVFDAAFSGDLVTVGDPKQAIYRFRGADVHAYLTATADHPTVDLRTNHRSDADLVAATNVLVGGVQLGDERIAAMPVDAAPGRPARAIRPGAPVTIRRVPDDPALHNGRGKVSAPLARRAILDDLVGVLVDLFDRHTIDRDGAAKPVRPGDVAVLVPSHATAEQTVRALQRAGIPAVRTKTGSVFETDAADEWARLLTALEQPSRAAAVRAAALGAFFHRSPEDIDPLRSDADERLAELQSSCATWAARLDRKPFLAWYDAIRSRSGVVEHVLRRSGGDRLLTDLDHIAELLGAELGARTSAAAARRCLDRLRVDGVEQLGDDDPEMRRIDSDAHAVQVTTLHASKGLQYPIVLLPFSWDVPNRRGAWVYHEDDGTLVVDVAHQAKWDADRPRSTSERDLAAKLEDRGDRLRLLYVALTRAQHRTVVWWAPAEGAGQSALATVLFDRDTDGTPRHDVPRITVGPRGGMNETGGKVDISDSTVVGHLDRLVERHQGWFDVRVVDVDTPPIRWVPTADGDAVDLAVADSYGRVVDDPAWRRWSFTSIGRTRLHDWSPPIPIEPTRTGGLDEAVPDPDQVGPVSDDDGAASVAQDTGGTAAPALPLGDVLAGAAFGTLVHGVLERIDPAAVSLESDLAVEVERALRRDRLDVDGPVLVAGLAAALRTPLGPIAGGLRLVDVGTRDRLTELDVDLPLCSTAGRFPVSAIGEVLLDTIDPDDPQRPYAEELAAGRFELELAGFLQGSVDAVLRVPGDATGDPDGHRYLVVDYKTNRLHARGSVDPMAAYRADVLPAVMAQSDYVLQALLYSVAVHRMLRWRLAGYEPDRHLGGIAYLFVRGMVGPGTPTDHLGRPAGVFSWRPPAATVLGLDRLFGRGRAT